MGFSQAYRMAAQETGVSHLISLDLHSAKQDNPDMKQNPHAQALGSLGGRARAETLSPSEVSKIASQGGKARAEKLSAAERKRIAKQAVAARERKRAQARKGDQ